MADFPGETDPASNFGDLSALLAAATSEEPPPSDAFGDNGVFDQRLIDSMLGFTAGAGGLSDMAGVRALTETPDVQHERLPVLETVCEHIVRLMRNSIRNLTAENIEVAVDRITTVRFGNYMMSVPLPATLAVIGAQPWNNPGIVTIHANLIFAYIDMILGRPSGGIPPVIEGRSFTSIELGLIRNLIDRVLTSAEDAFRPITPVKLDIDRLETNPRFASIARPASMAVLARFFLEIGGQRGNFDIVLPHATLEPIRDVLLQSFIGDKLGRDPIWEEHLATEIWSAEVDVSAVVFQGEMPLSRMMDLQVGDTLVLDVRPDDLVSLQCEGTILSYGRMGRADDFMAVKVATPLRRSRTMLDVLDPQTSR